MLKHNERTLKAIGIALLVNGVLLITFGALAYLVDTFTSIFCSGLWTGHLVFLTGILSFASKSCSSFCYLCTCLAIAILSISSIGFLAVISANTVAKELEDSSSLTPFLQRPTLAVNLALLVISIV